MPRLIFVFEIRLKPGHTIEQYRFDWQNGSDRIVQELGCKCTTLFRSLTDPNLLIAMPEWESIEARIDAMEKINNPDHPDYDLTHRHLEHADFVLSPGWLEEIGYAEH